MYFLPPKKKKTLDFWSLRKSWKIWQGCDAPPGPHSCVRTLGHPGFRLPGPAFQATFLLLGDSFAPSSSRGPGSVKERVRSLGQRRTAGLGPQASSPSLSMMIVAAPWLAGSEPALTSHSSIPEAPSSAEKHGLTLHLASRPRQAPLGGMGLGLLAWKEEWKQGHGHREGTDLHVAGVCLCAVCVRTRVCLPPPPSSSSSLSELHRPEHTSWKLANVFHLSYMCLLHFEPVFFIKGDVT